MAEKEKIYLTFIGLHARGVRPTMNFAKVAEKGRLFVPFKKPELEVPRSDGKQTSSFAIEFPPDLQGRIARNEVEIMIPAEGLYIYAGKDLMKQLEKKETKKRNMGKHNALVNRNRHK